MQERPRRRPRGFTLVEILVVVTIIIVLVSLGVAVAGYIQTKTRIDQTKLVLKVLAGASGDYRASTGGQVVDVLDPNIKGATGIEKFLTVIEQTGSSSQQLDKIKTYIGDTDRNTFREVRDAWDTPIRYLHANPYLRTEIDGTVTQVFDDAMPSSRGPIFVSNGPDTKPGKYTDDVPDREAQDNISSLKLE